ncbi:MAG: hypothetical protein KBA26_11535, partial [Candidatus Delongbacteria bacterium]|nr:hypothetical protein [Candidatus Delongbacteria bacterium]
QSIRIGLLKDFLNPLYTLFKKGQREGTFIKTIDPEVAIQLLFGMVENSIRSILIGVIQYDFEYKNLMIVKDNIIKIFFEGTLMPKARLKK